MLVVKKNLQYNEGEVTNDGQPGYLYLIHFDKPVAHAQHYLGYTTDLDKRFKRHAKLDGARLVRAAIQNGAECTVVRLWRNADKNFERKLKNRKNHRALCPICKGEKV